MDQPFILQQWRQPISHLHLEGRISCPAGMVNVLIPSLLVCYSVTTAPISQ